MKIQSIHTVLIIIMLGTSLSNAQVGIGNTDPKAVLDITASNQANPANTDGILIPRIDDFSLIDPEIDQEGILVYATGNGTPNKGFYFWDHSIMQWVSLIGGIGVEKINDLSDGKSDNDGTEDGSSVFLGLNAGVNDDSTNNMNVGIGYEALKSNTLGSQNVATGYQALYNSTTGLYNTAIGSNALSSNTIGNANVANGFYPLNSNTSGSYNVALGYYTLHNNISGGFNIGMGFYSLNTNTTGRSNVAIGSHSLRSNISGNYSVAIGTSALFGTTGSHNTAIGYKSNSLLNNYTNTTAIGYNTSISASNSIRLGDATITTIGGYANWTNVSDSRFKTNIEENVVGLDFIKKLRPVTYTLDMDAIARFNKTPDSLRLKESEILKAKELQTGFIAQEVEKAAKSVGYNFHGIDIPKNSQSHYGLRYAEFVVPLVKAVQEQQVIITNSELRIKELELENLLFKTRLDSLEKMIKKLKQ